MVISNQQPGYEPLPRLFRTIACHAAYRRKRDFKHNVSSGSNTAMRPGHRRQALVSLSTSSSRHCATIALERAQKASAAHFEVAGCIECIRNESEREHLGNSRLSVRSNACNVGYCQIKSDQHQLVYRMAVGCALHRRSEISFLLAAESCRLSASRRPSSTHIQFTLQRMQCRHISTSSRLREMIQR